MDNKKNDKKVEDKIEEVLKKTDKSGEVTETEAKKGNEHIEKRIQELEDQLKRAVADYRNLERRSSEERIEAIRFANKQLIEALLPAFDTLFLAGKYTTDESVKLTIGRMLGVLKDNGIEKVNTDNVKYDAGVMEGVEVVEGDKDMIIEEVRPGFTIYGKLIRPAQVKVGGGN